MKLDKETYLSMFSTLASSYAAIVGIVAVLVLYRVTYLGGLEVESKKLVDNYFKTTQSKSVYQCDNRTLIEKCPELIKECRKSPCNDPVICQGLQDLYNAVNTKGRLKCEFSVFVAFHMPLILAAILLLPFSKCLADRSDSRNWKSQYCLLAAIIIISFYLIWRVGDRVLNLAGID
jgi:hypothetical protein